MLIDPRTIQVRREAAMRQQLADNYGIRKGLEFLKHHRNGRGYGYRRSLLTRALRLTRDMAPEIADIITECKRIIGYERPIEVFVTPENHFNASCQREPGHGPTILTLSSRLLEAFTVPELRFVIGHELGHASFDHYELPMPIIATLTDRVGVKFVDRHTSIDLYAWCRAAELSADRVGLICAGDPEAAASGFFKLASGIASDKLKPDLAAFARQVESLASAPEARQKPRPDDDTLDCFSTHPYNPVRVRAVWAFSRSKPYLDYVGRSSHDALSMEQVESIIERDLTLMDPIYLQEKGDDADALRRLLFTAGILVADAYQGVTQSELEALGLLLGEEYASAPDDIELARKNFPGRLEAVKGLPLANKAALIQHLTIIAAADGVVQEEELRVMEDVAHQLEVDIRIIHDTLRGSMHPLD
ncbi:MAG: M48 family metallopeptidase [Bradymonadia bacterium]